MSHAPATDPLNMHAMRAALSPPPSPTSVGLPPPYATLDPTKNEFGASLYQTLLTRHTVWAAAHKAESEYRTAIHYSPEYATPAQIDGFMDFVRGLKQKTEVALEVLYRVREQYRRFLEDEFEYEYARGVDDVGGKR